MADEDGYSSSVDDLKSDSKISVEKLKGNIGKNQVKKSKLQVKVEVRKKEEKWKVTEIERFLELYEMHPCLWDFKVPEYKNRNCKEYAWEEIVRNMMKHEFTVKKAKEKIRVLRNTYSNELVKIQKSRITGAGIEDQYTPTLRWFSTMDRILGAVVQIRGRQDIGLNEIQSQEWTIHEKQDELDIEGVEQSFPSLSLPSTSSRHKACDKTSSASNINATPYTRPMVRTVAADCFNKIESAVKELKDLCNEVLVPENNPVKANCELDLFGQFISSQLKKLPELNALAVMQHIQTHLLEQRIFVARQANECRSSNPNEKTD